MVHISRSLQTDEWGIQSTATILAQWGSERSGNTQWFIEIWTLFHIQSWLHWEVSFIFWLTKRRLPFSSPNSCLHLPLLPMSSPLPPLSPVSPPSSFPHFLFPLHHLFGIKIQNLAHARQAVYHGHTSFVFITILFLLFSTQFNKKLGLLWVCLTPIPKVDEHIWWWCRGLGGAKILVNS